MKGKMKIMLLGVLAACALSAVVSASASAAQWHVAGATFSGTETITSKIKASTTAVLTSTLPGSKAKVLIACTTISSTGASIFANNKDSAAKITFTGCSSSEPAGCVSQTEITTKPVNTEITTSGELVFDKFTPSTGTEFTSIKLTGSACEGVFHIFGNARGLIVAPATEAVEKELLFSASTGSELLFAKEPAQLAGTAVFALSGGKKGSVWSGKVS